MNVRNDMENLSSMLGIQSQSVSSAAAERAGHAASSAPLNSDEARVSSAGSSVSQAASSPDVRMEKVVAVKSAIAAGTYSVPSSAVASKVVDSLLANPALKH